MDSSAINIFPPTKNLTRLSRHTRLAENVILILYSCHSEEVVGLLSHQHLPADEESNAVFSDPSLGFCATPPTPVDVLSFIGNPQPEEVVLEYPQLCVPGRSRGPPTADSVPSVVASTSPLSTRPNHGPLHKHSESRWGCSDTWQASKETRCSGTAE